MAQSRLERIGTIYTRTKSLLRGGAMKPEDIPLWYPIFEAFPPQMEPRYNREVPDIPIRQIFYKEDVVRAKFQKDHKTLLSSNLISAKSPSSTQRFLAIYEKMKESGTPEEQLYSSALEAYRVEAEAFRQTTKKAPAPNDSTENNDRIVEPANIDLKKVFEK